jgi:hypothetical protein
MIPPFDILRVDADGHLHWIQAIDTLDAAKARVVELIKTVPSEYLIISHRTGRKISVKPGGDT